MWFKSEDDRRTTAFPNDESSVASLVGELVRNTDEDANDGIGPGRKDPSRLSFGLSEVGLDQSHLEQPKKVLDVMFQKSAVIDQSTIDARIKLIQGAQMSEALNHDYVMVDPESVRYQAWLLILIFLGAFSVSTTAYYQSFSDLFSRFHAIFIIDWLVDLMFAANIVLHFSVGYVDEEGLKVMCRKAVRRRYLYSFDFMLSSFASVPWDVLQVIIGWAPWLRVTKFLRALMLRNYLNRLMTLTENPTVINYIALLRLILTWLLLPNIFCMFRILLIKEGGAGASANDEWKNRERNMPSLLDSSDETPHPTLYLRSLHWCMGVMSGYSDGTIPITPIQYLFTLLVLNIGLFTFAYTVGAISAMGEANAQRLREFQIAVSAMQHFVRRYELPPAYTKRITDYFAHRWELVKSNEKELVTAAELLEELPPCVRYDAVECMTAEALAKVPLFARVEEGFIHALTQKMEPVSTSIGEMLVRQGEVCDGLYIVLKGRLELANNGKVMEEIGKGACIGEMSMLTGLPAVASVTSLSFCELYCLRREPFEDLSHKFADTFEGFKQAAKLEEKNMKKRMKVGGKKNMSAAASMDTDIDNSSAAGGSLRGALRRNLLPRLPVRPHSHTRAVWAALYLGALSYEAFSLPFKVVFFSNRVDAGATIMDALCDAFFLLDIFLRANLAYTEDGRVITDRKMIRARFRRRRFLAPLIASSFPCSMLLSLWPLVDARILQLFRVTRVLRAIPAVLGYTDSVQRQQPSSLEELFMQARKSAFDLQFALNRLVPLLAMYFLCVHYVGCLYWATVGIVVPADAPAADGTYGPEGPVWFNQTLAQLNANIANSEWLPEAQYLRSGNILWFYLRSFYFATCNLTGLGAAVVPNAVPAVLFTLACFIIGVMVFAYLTSAIVTLVMQADAAKVSYKSKSLQLLRFMQDAGIDEPVIHRASKWLVQWWSAHGGVNLDAVIATLPPSLSLEIKMYVFTTATRSNVFWAPSRTGNAVSQRDILKLVNDIRFEVYNHQEWVLRKGMLNDKFFIIAIGKVHVLLDDGTEIKGGRRRRSVMSTPLDNIVVAELGAGECLGEHSAITQGKCEASVRAEGSVELLTISRETMRRLAERNPLIKHRLYRLMRQRFAENLYLTTGKLTISSTANAIKYMRQFVNNFRRRKAAGTLRIQQAAAAGNSTTTEGTGGTAEVASAAAAAKSLMTPKSAVRKTPVIAAKAAQADGWSTSDPLAA